jgi:hypothetical protein
LEKPWGFLCCCFSSFVKLPAAFYVHHEAVAMHAAWEIIILIDRNEIWTTAEASGFVVLRASYSFLQETGCQESHTIKLR